MLISFVDWGKFTVNLLFWYNNHVFFLLIRVFKAKDRRAVLWRIFVIEMMNSWSLYIWNPKITKLKTIITKNIFHSNHVYLDMSRQILKITTFTMDYYPDLWLLSILFRFFRRLRCIWSSLLLLGLWLQVVFAIFARIVIDFLQSTPFFRMIIDQIMCHHCGSFTLLRWTFRAVAGDCIGKWVCNNKKTNQQPDDNDLSWFIWINHITFQFAAVRCARSFVQQATHIRFAHPIIFQQVIQIDVVVSGCVRGRCFLNFYGTHHISTDNTENQNQNKLRTHDCTAHSDIAHAYR